MPSTLRLRRLALSLSLVAASVSGPGCLSFLHPAALPPGEIQGIVGDLPGPSQKGVDIFVFNGADPLWYANVAGLRDHLVDAGFARVWFGEVYHGRGFRDQVRLIHKRTPREKIVVVGFDYGAEAARSMACDLAAEGIEIDLLMLLEPRGLSLTPTSPLLPILRKVVVSGRANGDLMEPIRGHEMVRLPGVGRWEVPSSPETLRLLTAEVMQVALRVEVVGPSPFPIELRETPPPPRPIADPDAPLPAGWEWVRPVYSR